MKALIAMSGGVDSAVAALLMKRAGFDCVGVTMKLFDSAPSAAQCGKTCCSADDAADARGVANLLGIPFYALNMKNGFKREVIARFVRQYRRGLTPNPCIDCNRYIKFCHLLKRARAMGFDAMATGHYARVREGPNGRWLLEKSSDSSKDQTYVLYAMTQEELALTKFPLGDFTKAEIREIAKENGFANASKPDSQDICFVPDGDYPRFIEEFTGERRVPGEFVDSRGAVLGRHGGAFSYTIGQRKGLNVSFGEPMYVQNVDITTNRVTLGRDSELYSRELSVSDINLIAAERLDSPIRAEVKIRYRHAAAPATVEQAGADSLKIIFDLPQRAITPGQAAVIYDGDTVIGGGCIT